MSTKLTIHNKLCFQLFYKTSCLSPFVCVSVCIYIYIIFFIVIVLRFAVWFRKDGLRPKEQTAITRFTTWHRSWSYQRGVFLTSDPRLVPALRTISLLSTPLSIYKHFHLVTAWNGNGFYISSISIASVGLSNQQSRFVPCDRSLYHHMPSDGEH